MADIVRIDLTDIGGFFAGSSCVFGVFDGFHRGHRYMVGQAKATALEGGRTLAITFDIDPDEVFAPERLRKLLTNEERLRLLADSGIDAVAVLPFTSGLASQSPGECLETLFGRGCPSFVHVGEDFRFGCRGAGTVHELSSWGAERGMNVIAHPLYRLQGAPVTATRIRELLADGDVEGAAQLLGRPFFLTGMVVAGRRSGRTFGIPTANLDIDEHRICVHDGVYGCRTSIDGVAYNAAVCVGIPPTFESKAKQRIEAHIIDFAGDVYGRSLTLDFVQFIRPNRVFTSVDELVSTLRDNIATIRETQPL